MAGLMDLITQSIGGNGTRQISNQIGANEGTTQAAIAAALPMLLAALANNSSTPDGARSLDAALARDHDGAALDDVSSVVNNAEAGPGAGILRHLLGDRQPHAQQAVAQASGIDPARAGQILMMLAPIVMGALGRARRQNNADASGVAQILGNEHADLSQSSPDLMGLANRLLDRNGDGSFMDEIGGIAGKLFGGR